MFLDFILILEHSYFLHQQEVQNPIETAAKQYSSSGISARVAKALTKLYPQYKPQKEECEKMTQLIIELISEHIICKPYDPCLWVFIKIFIAKNISTWSERFDTVYGYY